MQTGTLTTTKNPTSGDILATGAKIVGIAGVAEALGTRLNINEVLIQAIRTNTAPVYIGPSTVANDNSNGIYLDKGDSVRFYATSLAEIYVNAALGGEGVTYLVW